MLKIVTDMSRYKRMLGLTVSMHKKRLALKNPREPVPSPGVAPTKRQQYPHTHRSSHCHQSASYHRARRNWKQLIHSEAFRRYVTARRINDVMSSKGHMPGTFQFRFVTTPLTVAFDQMKATLPHSGMPLLRNVFGCFRPFNVTALMGSSGAGKVTGFHQQCAFYEFSYMCIRIYNCVLVYTCICRMMILQWNSN